MPFLIGVAKIRISALRSRILKAPAPQMDVLDIIISLMS